MAAKIFGPNYTTCENARIGIDILQQQHPILILPEASTCASRSQSNREWAIVSQNRIADACHTRCRASRWAGSAAGLRYPPLALAYRRPAGRAFSGVPVSERRISGDATWSRLRLAGGRDRRFGSRLCDLPCCDNRADCAEPRRRCRSDDGKDSPDKPRSDRPAGASEEAHTEPYSDQIQIDGGGHVGLSLVLVGENKRALPQPPAPPLGSIDLFCFRQIRADPSE